MLLVLQVLPGAAPALARELDRVGLGAPDHRVDETTEELELQAPATPETVTQLAGLRTAVAAYAVISSPAPRPTGLTATEVLREFRSVLDLLARQRPRVRFSALRLEAAGSDTPQMLRVAQELAAVAGLGVDPEDGDLLVRVRRGSPSRSAVTLRTDEDTRVGWELLVRTTPRPLATRAWRTERYPGALNATIAAAVVDALDPTPQDRFADLMCGSGTLVIERMARGRCEAVRGWDLAPEAVAATQKHLRAARVRGSVQIATADVANLTLPDGEEPFTRIVANPPWGELLGSHATNDALHAQLLDALDRLGSPDLLAGILTHDIRRFEAALDADPRWHLLDAERYFAKGHHPRLFRLVRA